MRARAMGHEGGVRAGRAPNARLDGQRPSPAVSAAGWLVSFGRALVSGAGFSIVEMLISLLILLFVSLALMQTALVTTEINTRNAIRDNGARLAGETLDEIRNMPFDNIDSLNNKQSIQTLKVRNIDVQYTVYNTVTKVGTGDVRRLDIRVDWSWRAEIFNAVVSTIHSRQ